MKIIIECLFLWFTRIERTAEPWRRAGIRLCFRSTASAQLFGGSSFASDVQLVGGSGDSRRDEADCGGWSTLVVFFSLALLDVVDGGSAGSPTDAPAMFCSAKRHLDLVNTIRIALNGLAETPASSRIDNKRVCPAEMISFQGQCDQSLLINPNAFITFEKSEIEVAISQILCIYRNDARSKPIHFFSVFLSSSDPAVIWSVKV